MTDSSNTATRCRKGAIKLKETMIVNGHQMTRHYFKSPTYCTHCGQFIWGITKSQGYRCLVCQFSCHFRCCEYILFPCKGSDVGVTSNNENPHNFIPISILPSKSCDHCGSFVFSKGLKCNKCLTIIHPKCKEHVPNLCGVSYTERRGRICLTMKVKDEKICAEIFEARNLPAMDPNGLADPYVKMKIEDPDRKAKGRTIKNTKDPFWDGEVLSLKLNPDDYHKRVVIEVWDYDLTSENDFIGSLSFRIKDVASENSVFVKKNWYRLLKSDEGKLMHILIHENATPTVPETIESENKIAGIVEKKMGTSFSIDKFKILTVVGRGSFGKVMLALLISSKSIFAIKALRKDFLIMDDDVECALNERDIMSCLDSQFCIKIFCSFQSFDRLYLVLEYAPGGDLMGRLISIGKFSEKDAKFYLEEIAEAIIYLHSHSIINRDIKMENILLDKGGHVKMADFGMAKKIGENDLAKTFCGTPEYIAPEIIRREKYGKSVDWWSFGILCYHMLKGAPPFMTDDDSLLFAMILQSEVKYPKWFSPAAVSFMTNLLTKSPNTRLGSGVNGSDTIRTHIFFQFTDWNAVVNLEQKSPFIPKIKSLFDCSNFDPEFTNESTRPSKVDKHVLANYDHNQFGNFSFVNSGFPLEI